MADFAQFRAITGIQGPPGVFWTDDPVDLRTGTPFTDVGFIVDLPDLDSNRPLILMFKVSGKANSRLQMGNDPTATTAFTLIDFVLDDTFTKPRSWHEIIPGNQFSKTNNKFSMNLAGNPAGGQRVIVSDVVFLYHAHT